MLTFAGTPVSKAWTVMKGINKYIIGFLKGFLVLFLVLLFIELLLYFTAPVYDFPGPAPFSGDRFYNPYEGVDGTSWKKANFHFHSRAWWGLTSGRENTYEEFYRIYKMLGYHYPQISDYQRINRHFSDSSFYIPAYEHGYGIRKKHHILIGAKEILWLDYSLYQNLHHKQHILNLLRDRNEIVAIAHPDWDNGFPTEHIKYLSNYDLLEVLDQNWRSVPQWDAALSAGHPVYILANDDAHDIRDAYEIGRCCTFIHSPAGTPGEIIRNLKEGKAFGADVYMPDGESFEQKSISAEQIPILRSVRISGDTLRVETDREAMKFTFIGQNGKIRKVARFTRSAFYVLQPEDTYIRTEICFYNQWKGPGTLFYLNPVFRYNGEKPGNPLRAEVNIIRTWIFRIFAIPSLFFLAGLLVYFYGKRSRLKKRTT
jgi:hypothetical protein